MQKTMIILLVLFIQTELSAQQLIAEVFSAYNMTAYNTDQLDKGAYMPIGIRVAGGHEYVQLGLEYRQSISRPELTFTPNDKLTVLYDEAYYGALLRVNLSSLPVYRAGFVIKGGAGYYQYKQSVQQDGTDLAALAHSFDRKLGFNAGAGLSLPIYGMFHLEIGWQYNMVDRDEYLGSDLVISPYKANYHSFQFGFSTNFMFGKKSIECKNRRHRRRRGKNGPQGWYNKG